MLWKQDERKKKKEEEESNRREARDAKVAQMDKLKAGPTPNFVITKKSGGVPMGGEVRIVLWRNITAM